MVHDLRTQTHARRRVVRCNSHHGEGRRALIQREEGKNVSTTERSITVANDDSLSAFVRQAKRRLIVLVPALTGLWRARSASSGGP